MLKKFKDTVHQTLEHYGVQDEKLELVLSDLFDSFERRLLSRDFVREFERRLDDRYKQINRSKGYN